MLQALFTVLEREITNPEPIFILSPTAVVHTYCRNHRDCGENDVVKNYIDFLERNVLEQLKKNLLIRANREKVCLIFFSRKMKLILIKRGFDPSLSCIRVILASFMKQNVCFFLFLTENIFILGDNRHIRHW